MAEMAEKGNPGKQGENRRNGGESSKIKAQAYEFLDDGKIENLYDAAKKQLESLFSGTMSIDSVKQINTFSDQLILLDGEMRKRELRGYEQEEPADEEDTTSEDAYRAWEEKATGVDQVKATNERLETIRKVDGKKGVRENYKDKKIDGKTKTAFEQLWDEAHDENKAFDRKREANAKKEEARLQKEAEAKAEDERLERVRAEQDYEKQEWDNIERHGAEKETDVIKAHQEAFKDGREGPDGEKIYSEKNFKSYGELYDRAQKDNKELIDFRKTTEYKAEQSLKPIYKEIDTLHKEFSDNIKVFEQRSLSEKLSYPVRSLVEQLYSVGKNKERMKNLENLRYDLTNEESYYMDEKSKIAKEFDSFPPDTAEKMQKMYDGSLADNKIKSEYERVQREMKILEENHKQEKARIRRELQALGDKIYQADDPQMQGLIEMGVVFEESQTVSESDFSGINSRKLSPDEEIYRNEQENELAKDNTFKLRIADRRGYMEKNAQLGESSDVAERDKQIEREIEKYKQKIIEARIRIRRLAKMIESEKRKSPEKMNMALIKEAGKRIQEESLGTYNVGKDLREHVIMIDHRSRLQKLADKLPWSGMNWGVKNDRK